MTGITGNLLLYQERTLPGWDGSGNINETEVTDMDMIKNGKENAADKGCLESGPAGAQQKRMLYPERWRDLVISLYDRRIRISGRLTKKIERIGRKFSVREEWGRISCREDRQMS